MGDLGDPRHVVHVTGLVHDVGEEHQGRVVVDGPVEGLLGHGKAVVHGEYDQFVPGIEQVRHGLQDIDVGGEIHAVGYDAAPPRPLLQRTGNQLEEVDRRRVGDDHLVG